MKHAMGAALVLALGLGFAVSAQANNIKSQNAMPSMQNGSTQQMQPTQPRKQRITKQRTGKSHLALGHHKGKMALAQKQRIGKTRLATLKQRKGMQFAKLHQKPGKTRIATLNRHNRHQTVGVGSSTPTTGTNVMPQAPNNAGGTQNAQ